MDVDIKLTPQSASLLSGAWNKIAPFDQITSGLLELKKKALNTAAFVIRKSIADEFVRRMPAAGRPFKVPATTKGGYKITRPDMLSEAVFQSSSDGNHARVFMGGREPNSPLFIARMYNIDSRDRYVRTKKGKKLRKPRFVGHLTGVDYWQPGIAAGEQQAIQAITNIFSAQLKKQLGI